MDLATKVWLANEVRVWGLLATAIIGGISWAAALTHSRWQSELSVENARIAQDKERVSNEKIAELRKDTAEATARAEEAKLQLARFRAPRSLSEEQRATILNEVKGKVTEINVVSQVDAEARFYALQFRSLFSSAGIKVNVGSLPPSDTMVLGPPNSVHIWTPMGLVGGYPRDDDPLYRAVSRAGIWGGFRA